MSFANNAANVSTVGMFSNGDAIQHLPFREPNGAFLFSA
jgi:hypothetical protein